MLKSLYKISILLVATIFIFSTSNGQTRVGKFGLGLEGSMQYALGGGTVTTTPALGGGINASLSMAKGFGLRAKFIINKLEWTGNASTKAIQTDFMSLNAYLTADLMPNSMFNVFVGGGGGFAFYDPKNNDGTRASGSSFDMQLIGTIGIDYFLNEFWSISMMGEYVMTGSQNYVGNKNAVGNIPNVDKDSFLRGSIQIRYYFFEQSFVKKLLGKQRDRMQR